MLAATTALLRLRRAWPVLTDPSAAHDVRRDGDVVVVTRALDAVTTRLILVFGTTPVDVALDGAGWSVAFDADDPRCGGAGVTVFEGDRLHSGAPNALLLVRAP